MLPSEINIDALRHYRENARFQNWIPYLKTEIFKKLYGPRNLAKEFTSNENMKMQEKYSKRQSKNLLILGSTLQEKSKACWWMVLILCKT